MMSNERTYPLPLALYTASMAEGTPRLRSRNNECVLLRTDTQPDGNPLSSIPPRVSACISPVFVPHTRITREGDNAQSN